MPKKPSYADLEKRIQELEQQVSSLQETENVLRKSEEYFKALMEQNPISIQIYSLDGTLLDVNMAWQDMFQLHPDDFINTYNCLQDEQAVKLGSAMAFEQVRMGKSVAIPDSEYDPAASGFKLGRKRWMRSNFFPLKDHNDEIRHVILLHEDITEQVKTKEKYKRVVDNSKEAIFIIQNNSIIFHNQQFIEFTGFSSAEIRAKKFYDFVHPEDVSRVIDIYKRRMLGENPPELTQFKIISKTGEIKWAQTNSVIIEWEENPAALVFASEITELKLAEEVIRQHQDHLEQMITKRTKDLVLANKKLSIQIEERKKAETALVEEKSKVEAILAAIGDGLTVQDRNFRILYQNDFHQSSQGEHVGEYCYQAYQGSSTVCDHCILEKCFTDGKVHKHETSAETDTGTMYMEVAASPVKNAAGEIIAGVEIVRDITETKKLTAQLMQSQKMEAIGTLAGGIAHDFNNILTGIMGYADLLMMNDFNEQTRSESLHEIVMASKRAAELIKQILTFSRNTEQAHKPLNLQLVIKEIARLLRSSLPANITIQLNIEPICGAISGNATQLHQLILNLCTNALHAMQLTGGTLNISLRELIISTNAPLHTEDNIPPGKYACMVVSDTGHGINGDIIDRIFDPYFTSKPQGEGSGLGLSTVHGIVSSHHGHIRVRSQTAAGAAFEIYLPIQQITTTTNDDLSVQHLPIINAHVLLVDDEEMVKTVAGKLLEKIGCTVTSTVKSIDALELFRADPQQYDLILTDQTMPDMTGYELAKKILTLRPDIPIILATGHSETVNREIAMEVGIREFIMKPFDINILSCTIEKALQ